MYWNIKKNLANTCSTEDWRMLRVAVTTRLTRRRSGGKASLAGFLAREFSPRSGLLVSLLFGYQKDWRIYRKEKGCNDILRNIHEQLRGDGRGRQAPREAPARVSLW